mmetsp:Transcript_10363/g.18549  ORF Transcript_10363/g.18549 Transcript_10363/m.18549 type:complete len:162 (-) Transcript_10363:38-523(-)
MGCVFYRLISCICIALLTTHAEAARLPPKDVSPVNASGVEYRAPVSGVTDIGVVEAWDTESGLQLWQRKLYEICYCVNVETDVQWRFINGLEIRGHLLWVSSESKFEYLVDLATRTVSVVDPLADGLRGGWQDIRHYVGDTEPDQSLCDKQRRCRWQHLET